MRSNEHEKKAEIQIKKPLNGNSIFAPQFGSQLSRSDSILSDTHGSLDLPLYDFWARRDLRKEQEAKRSVTLNSENGKIVSCSVESALRR